MGALRTALAVGASFVVGRLWGSIRKAGGEAKDETYDPSDRDLKFLEIATEEAMQGFAQKDGGPFGAVIVEAKTGKIVAKGRNSVLLRNDPTAHAEMEAIQKACKSLGRIELSDCVMYTSCEPCPMSFAAIFLARIPKLVYGAQAESAVNVGFDGRNISDAIRGTAKHQKSDCQVKHLYHPKFDTLFQNAKEGGIKIY